jgi:hypothetical protein
VSVRPGFFADIGVAYTTLAVLGVLACSALAIWKGLG